MSADPFVDSILEDLKCCNDYFWPQYVKSALNRIAGRSYLESVLEPCWVVAIPERGCVFWAPIHLRVDPEMPRGTLVAHGFKRYQLIPSKELQPFAWVRIYSYVVGPTGARRHELADILPYNPNPAPK